VVLSTALKYTEIRYTRNTIEKYGKAISDVLTKLLVLFYVILLLLSYISLLALFAATVKSKSSTHNLVDVPKRNERTEEPERTVTTRRRKAIVDECQASLV
jgi:hypothetical protein